jgi:hypothetical protein
LNDTTQPNGIFVFQYPRERLPFFYLHHIRQSGGEIKIKGSGVSAIHLLDSDDGTHLFYPFFYVFLLDNISIYTIIHAMSKKSKKQTTFSFDDHFQRAVQVDFSGGHLSHDGGALLLRQIDRQDGISEALRRCFRDWRDPRYCDHTLRELLAQRLFGLALGYEDLNDHNALRADPLLALCVGKRDLLGADRLHDRDKALASAATLNRIEVGTQRQSKYHKIHADFPALQETLLYMALRFMAPDPHEVVLDFDNSDNPLHGEQIGRFFHGYYENYCYLPLYCFADSLLLWAELLPADEAPVKAMIVALPKIIAALRQRFPDVRIIMRCDSGFCREELFALCEDQLGLYYAIGMARNVRLLRELEDPFFEARMRACLCGGKARAFRAFAYRTEDSWSRSRTLIGKAEVLGDKDNPRFVVTNLPVDGWNQPGRFEPQQCYEDFYCQRGEAENHVKQQQLDLYATRSSSHWMEANQLRLSFSAFAYLMMERLRMLALQGTALASATAGTIRTRLLKIAAHLLIRCRRIHIRLASAFPLQNIFGIACRRLHMTV